MPVLAALLVTLIPTTIGGLLSAIGIAGMDRLVRFSVLATNGRAVEAAGDVDVRAVRGCTEEAQIFGVWASGRLGHRDARRFWPASEG